MDSYADAHEDTIYEALESEMKAKAPAFCGLLDEIEAWTWIGEVYCLFPKSKSLFTDRMRSDQPFSAVVRNFGYRHGFRIQLRDGHASGVRRGNRFSSANKGQSPDPQPTIR